MQITTHTRHFAMTDSIKDYVNKHLPAAVTKYFSDPETAEVTFSRESNRFDVEIRVHLAKKIEAVAHGMSHDAYAAFDEAMEHIAKKIRRHKRKIKNHHHKESEKEAMKAIYYVINQDDDSDSDSDADDEARDDDTQDAPMIIAEEDAEIRALTVAMAVMRLDLSGRNALLFKNSANGCLSMVYIRPDGNIGWVEPHLD